MDLTAFLSKKIDRATIPGQGVFARDLYNIYATERLSEPSPTPTPSFQSFTKELKSLGYRVARNTAKQRHGQIRIFDVVLR
jgi:hypothetical protein